MAELIFENLNFSFLVDQKKNTAYLQEWDDGRWSEAEEFAVPLSFARVPKGSRLGRAIREFRGGDSFRSLCSALGDAPPAEPNRVRQFFRDLQEVVA